MTASSLLRPATCQEGRCSKEDRVKKGGCTCVTLQQVHAPAVLQQVVPLACGMQSQSLIVSYNFWIGPSSESLGHCCIGQRLGWQLSLKPSNVAQVRCRCRYKSCRGIHHGLLIACRYKTPMLESTKVKALQGPVKP
jgi:hypothetical protein